MEDEEAGFSFSRDSTPNTSFSSSTLPNMKRGGGEDGKEGNGDGGREGRGMGREEEGREGGRKEGGGRRGSASVEALLPIHHLVPVHCLI